MFEILKHLRDINTLRHGGVDHWIEDNVLVVRIPLSDEDVEFYEATREMFAPVEES